MIFKGRLPQISRIKNSITGLLVTTPTKAKWHGGFTATPYCHCNLSYCLLLLLLLLHDFHIALITVFRRVGNNAGDVCFGDLAVVVV